MCTVGRHSTESISQISAAASMPQTAHNQSVARNVAVVLPLELSISLTLTLFVYVARFTTVSLRSSLTQLVSMSCHNPSVDRTHAHVQCGCRSVARTIGDQSDTHSVCIYTARSVSRSVAKSVCPITMSLSHARAVWPPLCRSN